MRLPNLFDHVREAVQRRGANLQEGHDLLQQGAAWPKPPLFTSLELDGAALQDYIRVITPTPLDDFVQAYEAFLDGYLYSDRDHKINPFEFVATVAQLKGHRARGLLTHYPKKEWAMPLRLMVTLIEFAAIAAYTWPCEVIDTDTRLIMTTEEGFSFGVVDGRPVSNLERPDFPRVMALAWPTRLSQYPRGKALVSREPSELDGLRFWLEMNADTLGADYFPLLQAMQIIKWHYPITVTSNADQRRRT